jgi:flagellin-specific chaperone FliS
VFECIGTVLSAASVNIQSGMIIISKILTPLDAMLRENKGDISTFILQIYSLIVRLVPPTPS